MPSIPSLSPTPPDLYSLLRAFGDTWGNLTHTSQIGTIFSYDPKTQTAKITLPVQTTINGVTIDATELHSVPVLVPPTYLSPILKGEDCLVIFTDNDIANWFAATYTTKPDQIIKDENGAPAIYLSQPGLPTSSRIHHFSSCYAIVGFRNQKSPVKNYITGTAADYNNADTVVQNENPVPDGSDLGETIIQNTGQKKRVRLLADKNGVQLSVSALYGKISCSNLDVDLKTILQDILTHIVAHTHSGVTTGGGNTGTPVNASDFNNDKTDVGKLFYTEPGP